MRTRLRPVVLGASLVLGLGLAAPITTQVTAHAADGIGWCSDDRPAPCVIAIERDDYDGNARDLGYDVVVRDVAAGSRGLAWDVTRSGDFDLGAEARSHRWKVTFEMGTVVPRVTFTKGRDVAVERIGTGLVGSPPVPSTYRVVVSVDPVRVTDNDECAVGTWPWVCPHHASNEYEAYLGGAITDYGAWDDAAQRASTYGMDYSTNIGVTSMPPEITTDAAGRDQLLLRMANQHEFPDGDEFRGFAKVRIPNAFLAETYGIDDPSTLRSAGIRTTLGSGSVAVTPGADALEVSASGITFSTRTLTIRSGKVTPKKPKKVKTKRTKKTRARVTFKKAKARGSSVSGHTVRCKAVKGKHVRKATTAKKKAVVKKLRNNRAYKCQVRAKSAAGNGKWSKPKKLKARPRSGR